MKKALIPLISLFIFVISNGFFMTFISLVLEKKGYSETVIGSMTAAFYAGLAIASLGIENIIAKVGHIRAFSAFVSGLAVVTMAQGFWINAGFWLVMRLAAGYFTAGLFVVVESWLLLLGTKQTRTKLLAIYMIAIYAAQAFGQLFINIQYKDPLLPYAVAAMLCSISVIPMAIMKLQAPSFDEPSRLNFLELFKLSASGVISCFCSGLILSGIYGLMPIFLLERLHHKVHDVSWLMSVVILGGMCLQYPIGRLSDYVERRFVLILICCLMAAMTIPLFFARQYFLLGVIMFSFGGLAFTIYPVAISLACDKLHVKHLTAAAQGLLLAYSIGCVIGPMLAATAMRFSKSYGYLGYFVMTNIGLAVFLAVRRVQQESVPQEEPFMPVPQTTPIAAELDPRG
ncbi:MAG: transporter [Gammaproteobacteria bacterium]|nr:transporter [Gammaproteobacteria bacterium]